jgi:uncharacterized protein
MKWGLHLAVLFFAISIGACSTAAKRENAGVSAISVRIPVPQLTGWVVDTVNLLLPADQERLSKLSQNYEQETGHQLVVLIVPTLEGEPIESFCLRTLKAWRLGRKGVDDGILVCLVPNERQVRIELGTGTNRYISNSQAKEIIDTEMIPSFRVKDFSEGLEHGLKRLMEEGRKHSTDSVTKKSWLLKMDHDVTTAG